MKPAPVVTLSIAAFAVLASLIPSGNEWLELSRQGIATSHFWRLVTGHFVHFGWPHLAWDVAAFMLLGIIAEPLFGTPQRTGNHRKPSGDRLAHGTRFAGFIVGVSLCLSLAVLWLQPHLARYRGLSGIDSALFGFIAQRLIERGRSLQRRSLVWLGSLSLVGFLVKCGYELATRQSAFVGQASTGLFEPVPLVHGLGLLLGMGYALLTAPRQLPLRAGASASSPIRARRNVPLQSRRKDPQIVQINAD